MQGFILLVAVLDFLAFPLFLSLYDEQTSESEERQSVLEYSGQHSRILYEKIEPSK